MPNLADNLWSNALLIAAGVALLWIGSVVIARMRREATATRLEDAGNDPLAPFEAAYRRGQMSDEEYGRIRQKLAAEGLIPPLSATRPRPRPTPPAAPPVEDATAPEPAAPAAEGEVPPAP